VSANDPIDAVVHIGGLTRCFGSKVALRDVTLEIPRGMVFGLVGANGAGKTTLIKHILGLLRAQRGMVRVFGLDPVRFPVQVLGRLGYLSEDRELSPWMTVAELLRYSRAFYRAWDDRYAEELRRRFQLPTSARVRHLSKGELAKAGLLVALAHRPELLLLDEPSSGLDPIVRREMLEAVVRSVAEEGRTVLFSSHLLDEIGRVSDGVAMIAQGRLVLWGRMRQILDAHRRLVVRWNDGAVPSAPPPGVLSMTPGSREWTLVCDAGSTDWRVSLSSARAEVLEDREATFEEIFHARVNPSDGVTSTSDGC
jgi:ABC-2 type transport system ATP-binding protein